MMSLVMVCRCFWYCVYVFVRTEIRSLSKYNQTLIGSEGFMQGYILGKCMNFKCIQNAFSYLFILTFNVSVILKSLNQMKQHFESISVKVCVGRGHSEV